MIFFSYFDKFIEHIHRNTHTNISEQENSLRPFKRQNKIAKYTCTHRNIQWTEKKRKFNVQKKSVAHFCWLFFLLRTISNWIAVLSQFNWFHHQEIENQGEFILHINKKMFRLVINSLFVWQNSAKKNFNQTEFAMTNDIVRFFFIIWSDVEWNSGMNQLKNKKFMCTEIMWWGIFIKFISYCIWMSVWVLHWLSQWVSVWACKQCMYVMCNDSMRVCVC